MTDIVMKSLHVNGIFVGNRDMFESMNRAIGQHGLKPVIDLVFPFTNTIAAYEYLKSGQHFGKIVINTDT
jgi:NADPH:quinone reductase-like Zn-dependent oxidoreductase